MLLKHLIPSILLGRSKEYGGGSRQQQYKMYVDWWGGTPFPELSTEHHKCHIKWKQQNQHMYSELSPSQLHLLLLLLMASDWKTVHLLLPFTLNSRYSHCSGSWKHTRTFSFSENLVYACNTFLRKPSFFLIFKTSSLSHPHVLYLFVLSSPPPFPSFLLCRKMRHVFLSVNYHKSMMTLPLCDPWRCSLLCTTTHMFSPTPGTCITTSGAVPAWKKN